MDTAKEITDLLDNRVEKLSEIAQDAANNYWTYHILCNKGQKNKSNLGCRLSRRGTQFAISWFTNSYLVKPNQEIKTFSTHLRKGRTSFRYPENVLRKAARAWEIDQVLEAENIFAAVREELNVLGKIRRSLSAQSRLSLKLQNICTPIPPEDNPKDDLQPSVVTKPELSNQALEDIPE